MYIVFSIYSRKVAIVSEVLFVIGRRLVGAAIEKVHLPIFGFVLGTKCCLVTVDLWVL